MRRWAVLAAVLVAAGCGSGPHDVMCLNGKPKLLRDGSLRVGYDLSAPPLGYIDPKTKRPAGFEIDVLTEVAKRSGRTVVFVNQVESGLMPAVLARRYDVGAAALHDAEDLRDQACVTKPYLSSRRATVTLASRTAEPASIGAPKGVDGTFARRFSSAAEAVDAVRNGVVDAVVLDSATARWYAHTDPAFRAGTESGPPRHYVAVVHPENGGLLAQINAALDAMRRDGTLDRLEERWFPGR